MTVWCCLPSQALADRVGAVDGVRTLVWDGAGEPPDPAGEVRFLVPRYTTGAPDERALAAMPGVEAVQLMSAGYDTWVTACPAATVSNARGVHGSSTAELAVGGLFMTWRELPALREQQLQGVWKPLARSSAQGKRVLVLGAGDVGRTIGAVLEVLGSEVGYVGQRARQGVHAVAELPDLVGEQDAVVVAAPLTEQTRGLVDARLLGRMRDGAVLVNVARGELVVTADLLPELASGRLRAVLDVTDPEPLPPDHPLWRAPGTIITPHVGGGTDGWLDRAAVLVREQLGRFVRGEPLAQVVRPRLDGPPG